MEKKFVEQKRIVFPQVGEKESWKIMSMDDHEQFLMDINRGRFQLIKCTYQERYLATEILIRVDVGGTTHQNPDGLLIHGPHIHQYREGYGDKWAESLPKIHFDDPTDLVKTFRDFLIYCNVKEVPEIQRSMQ